MRNLSAEIEVKIVKYLIEEMVYENTKNLLYKSLCSKDINWKKLIYILNYSSLCPFLYLLSKEISSSFPAQFTDFLRKCFYSDFFIYMILQQELKEILTLAKKEGVLVIPIKGFSLGEKYYQKFGLRPLLDIDLLIEEKEFEKGIELLENLDYKKNSLKGKEEYWRKYQCHLSFTKEVKNYKVNVDLHWALDCKRYKSKVIPDAWNRLKKINIEGENYSVLSPEDTLLSLALHQRRFGKMFNLKYVCDVGIILEKENIDWEYIIKTAFKEKIRLSLYFLLYQVNFALDKDLNNYTDRLKIPFLYKKLVCKIVEKYIFSPPDMQEIFYVYLLCHFLLYDNLVYPVTYILNIPQEQFAKFYSLPLYAKRTKKLYKLRLFYILYRITKKCLSYFTKRFFSLYD